MKCNKFSPETDFELKNLEVIEKLRKIKDKELTEDFNKKFFDRILKEKVQPIQKIGTIQKTIDVSKKILNVKRPTIAIGYASIFVCLVTIVFILFKKNDTGYIGEVKEYVVKTDSIDLKESQGHIMLGKSQQTQIKKYDLEKRYKEFMPYLKDGLLNIPTQHDFELILRSEKYINYIKRISSPTLADSVKVIIWILKEKNIDSQP